VKRTSWSTGLSFSADGTGLVAHAGNVATRLLADQVGLTGALSAAMARRGFTPTHDRGRVLVDVAVLIAGGGEAIADIDVLRHQGEVLGSVASAPTVWRALDEVTPAVAKRIDKARAKVRAHVWSQLPGGLPASKVADTDLGDTVVLDVDATLVTTHSEKEGSASTFKKGFGYHPLGVWCENTQESLALMLRPGNAGSNTAADHIAVLTAAIGQVPAAHRRKLLIRADGAGASHELLDWITALDAKRGRSVQYSVGYAVTENVREAIAKVPQSAWKPAITAQGEPREHGDVARDHRPAQTQHVAGRDAGPDPPRTPPPRGLVVPVRGRRRVALPSRGDQHPGRQGWAGRVPRSAPPRPRPGRDPDPAREGLWDRPIPVPAVRHQRRLDPRRVHRGRPHRLAAAPRPTRRIKGV
jgi:hypothetical protein